MKKYIREINKRISIYIVFLNKKKQKQNVHCDLRGHGYHQMAAPERNMDDVY